MENLVRSLAESSIETKREFFSAHSGLVVRAAETMIQSLRSGGKILVFGNGGSAADAQHIAGELVNRFHFDRPALPAVALTTDTSVLTSIGNDSSFDFVFSRQIEALGRAGDIALAISTSGNSPNVIEAVKSAKRLGMITIALLGHDGGRLASLADLPVIVEHRSTPRIQEVHMTVAHIVCELIESEMFRNRSAVKAEARL